MFAMALGVMFLLVTGADLTRGMAMLRQQQFAAAEQEFRRVLAANPKDGLARVYLARTLTETGRIPEALSEIEQALAAGADPDVRFQAGRIVRELAERRFAELERASPGAAPVRELAGRRYEMNGILDQALREYLAAAAMDTRRPGVHYLMGNVLWKMRRLDEAQEALRAELALSPHHGMANLRLGQVLRARDEDAAAEPYLAKAVNAMPDSVEARRELGKAYRKIGRAGEARREWEAIAKARPDDDQVHYLLGNLYRELGESALARAALEKHRAILGRRRAPAEKR